MLHKNDITHYLELLFMDLSLSRSVCLTLSRYLHECALAHINGHKKQL
jgi:hypothetical protein